MYFFSEEERKYLLKKLIPKAREKGIAEDLRGLNWHSTELSPPHDIFVPVWEVSDRYCETGRWSPVASTIRLWLSYILQHKG